jgi:tripartite motif-containing protein 71
VRPQGLALLIAAALAAGVLASPAAAAPAGWDFLGTWGSHGLGPSQFLLPDGISVDDRGTVWVADRDRNRIATFTRGGRYKRFKPFRERPLSSRPGRFNLPYDIAVSRNGRRIYVADTQNHRIQRFTRKGKLVRTFGRRGTAPGELHQPRGVAVDPFGNVWVADHENWRVQKFSPRGELLAVVGGLNAPRGLSSDPQGNIYVAVDATAKIVELDNSGRRIAEWGRQGTGDGELMLPYSTAVAPDGNVWVTDTNNNRIQEFTPDGRFVARYGRGPDGTTPGGGIGEFDHPYDLDFDCAGNLYVTDQGNKRVVKFGVPGASQGCAPR